MNSKLKTTILLIPILLAFVTSTKAQDKYDFAIVSYVVSQKYIEVDINGVDYQKIDVNSDNKKSPFLASAALQQVKKMNDEGWEMFDLLIRGARGNDHPHYTFLLRRKLD